MPDKVRRTPALTAEAREMFDIEVRNFGWTIVDTTRRIAEGTGLSEDQVRDAIWGESADTWRRALASRLRD